MEPSSQILEQSHWIALDAEASAHMERGLELLSSGSTAKARQALQCFTTAESLRRMLPIATVPQFAYGLAACWLNYAETIVGLREDNETCIAQALQKTTDAIRLLRALPLKEDPRFSRRLAVAFHNLGILLQLAGATPTKVSGPLEQAIAVLEAAESARIIDREQLLAAVYLSLASAYEHSTADGCAGDAALRAKALVASGELSDANAAEIGLKARHCHLKFLATSLLQQGTALQPDRGLLARTVIEVEEALTLARAWEKKGVSSFRNLAEVLFQFGARLHELFLPERLSSFVATNLNPAASSADYAGSVAMHHTAQMALARVNRTAKQSHVSALTIRWHI